MEKNQLSCSQLVFRIGLHLGKRLKIYADKEPLEDELLVRWLDPGNPLGGAWVCSTELKSYVPHNADPGFVERFIGLRTDGLPCGLCQTKANQGCIQCAQALCSSCTIDMVMKIDNPFQFACPFCRSDLSWIAQSAAASPRGFPTAA
jgi:hypothetical protein